MREPRICPVGVETECGIVMELVLRVAEIVAPVFVLAGLGFGWMRAGWDYPVGFVTQLATKVGVPCLIFATLVATEIDPTALGEMVLATVLGYGAVTLVTWGFVRALGLDRRTYLAPLTFGNTGNIGLPLALFAFGAEGLGYAVVLFAVMAVATFTYGIWMVAGRTSIWAMLREPMVVASVLGAIFLWQGWALPSWAGRSIDLLGQLGIPLMLLTLGVAIARLRPGQIGRSVWLSAVKALLNGGIAVFTGWILGLAAVPFAILVLQMMTPVAVTSYLLAERYNADSEAVAGLVVVSTLLSVAAMPLVIGLLMPL